MPQQPSVAIVGGGHFPVRRIYCIGRNYPDHAKEMGGDPTSEPPFFFQKPADAAYTVALDGTSDHAYPPLTADYQPEIELVVALRSGGREIASADALRHVFGYAIGLDMTRRDRQREMKAGQRPWELAKSFDNAAPMGPIVPVDAIGHKTAGAIRLIVNDKTRQKDDLSSMIWSVAQQICELSRGSELKGGDLIFTGTPAGVASVARGDLLHGQINGLPDLNLRIV